MPRTLPDGQARNSIKNGADLIPDNRAIHISWSRDARPWPRRRARAACMSGTLDCDHAFVPQTKGTVRRLHSHAVCLSLRSRNAMVSVFSCLGMTGSIDLHRNDKSGLVSDLELQADKTWGRVLRGSIKTGTFVAHVKSGCGSKPPTVTRKLVLLLLLL